MPYAERESAEAFSHRMMAGAVDYASGVMRREIESWYVGTDSGCFMASRGADRSGGSDCPHIPNGREGIAVPGWKHEKAKPPSSFDLWS